MYLYGWIAAVLFVLLALPLPCAAASKHAVHIPLAYNGIFPGSRPPVPMPSLIRMPLDDALDILRRLGFQRFTWTYRHHHFTEGLIFAQHPSASTLIDPRREMPVLYVSLGPAPP